MAVVFPFFQALANWIRPKPKFETPAGPSTTIISSRDLRDRWGAYPTSGLTPTRLIQIIRGSDTGYMSEVAELFEEMEEKDSHLCSVLQTRKLAVLGLDRLVMPYSTGTDEQGRRSQELADFVEHALDRIVNLDSALFNLMDAIGKGFSVCEINWVKQDNQILVDSLDWIHPKKITFVDSFEPRLVSDNEPFKGVPFPPWKTLYWCYRARSGWDTRAGLLRTVALLFLLKNYSLKDWASFNEVFGMPLRLGKYDPAASESDRQALYDAVRNLGSDAAAIVSKATEIEFIEAGARLAGNTNPYQVFLDYCNREMSKVVLGQTLSSDTSPGSGTLAGSAHAQVRQDLLEADGVALADVITKQLILPLIGFNFGWDVAKTICPYFKFSIKSQDDLHTLSSIYKNLLDAGVPISLNHINEKFDLPEIEEGEKYVGGDKLHDPRALQSATSIPALPVGESPEEEVAKRTVEAYIARYRPELEKPILMTQAKLDKIASDAIGLSADMGKMILRPVKKLIQEGKSLDEIKHGLEQVYGEIDPRELSNLLYMAMMLSYFQGYE